MQRYIALVFNEENPSTVACANRLIAHLCRNVVDRWEYRLAAPGMAVFTLPDRDVASCAYQLPNGSGVILGKLFCSGTVSSLALPSGDVLSEASAARIVSTHGKSLTDEFWGAYVAFLFDSVTRRRSVIRDCSGKLPCYRTVLNNVSVFFSDVGDATNLLQRYSIDWEYVAAFIFYSGLQTRKCAIREITELLAGDCVTLLGDSESHFSFWDPRQICRRATITDSVQAGAALRNTVQNCINEWAGVYDKILHMLSGGLDSSIVLGCVTKAPRRPKVTCLNTYNDFAGEDERSYARQAAELCGVRLIEQPGTAVQVTFDKRRFRSPMTAKPTLPLCFGVDDMRYQSAIATELGAQAIWTGQGGDHIFFQGTAPLAAADYAHYNGFNIGLIRALRDSARLANQSYWSVFRRSFLTSKASTRWVPDFLRDYKPVFVHSDGMLPAPLAYITHPWNLDSDDLSEAKQRHIFLLADVVNRHRPLPRTEGVPEHHPLLSQPLLELCLQIPVYLLMKNGRDRGLARDSFASLIPTQVALREDKGESTSNLLNILKQNKKFIRDVLIDGMLVKERVLDREALLPYLAGGSPIRPEHFFPLLSCVTAELWARSCSDALCPTKADALVG